MTSPTPSPVLIVGTGALGCLFAARLSAAGIPVTLLGSWPEGLEALARNGVILVEADGRQQAYPVQVATEASECVGAKAALVLVKSWQTQHAARQLARCLPADGLALTLQNGMGNLETLVRHLGASRVALGVTTAGATLLGPGQVRAAGDVRGTAPITLGIHARLAPLVELLRAAGFVIETVNDTTSLLWGKLVINAAINPLTALLGVSNGELLARPTARTLLTTVAREAASVAVAKGVNLPYPDPVIATEAIARSTASNRSSMLQDVERGAPTEVDAISGAIVRAGEETSVPTPVNRTLWQLVKGMVEQGSKG